MLRVISLGFILFLLPQRLSHGAESSIKYLNGRGGEVTVTSTLCLFKDFSTTDAFLLKQLKGRCGHKKVIVKLSRPSVLKMRWMKRHFGVDPSQDTLRR